MVQDFIEEQIRQLESGSTAIFCGAGVSFDSGLPTVPSIVREILGRLDLEDSERQFVTDQMLAGQLPFESFMETLQDVTLSIGPVLEIFDQGRPNHTHRLIARLVEQGRVRDIFTTNFDRLFERALMELGLEQDRDFEVYWDDERLAEVDWGAGDRARLIKLHGSVEDEASLVVTMRRVSRKALSAPCNAAVDHLFSSGPHDHVLVLGYSCSDTFDISRQIEAIRTGFKKVTLIEHTVPETQSTPAAKPQWRLEALGKRESKNPFRSRFDGVRAFGDTSDLVEQVWLRLVDPELERVQDPQVGWRDNIDRWAEPTIQHPERAHHYNPLACGTLLRKLSRPSDAVRHWQRGLGLSRDREDALASGAYLSNIGSSLAELGEVERAIECFRQALGFLDETGGPKRRAQALVGLGSAHSALGDYPVSIEFFREAMSLVQVHRVPAMAGHIANHLGSAFSGLGRYSEAAGFHQIALESALAEGDKDGEGAALNNLGGCSDRQGRYEEAIHYFSHAAEIYRSLGTLSSEGRAINNMGSSHFLAGRVDEAVICFRQALEMSASARDRHLETLSRGNLGAALVRMERFEEAADQLQKSATLAREIGDRENEAQHLSNLAAVHVQLRQFQEAGRWIEESSTIAQEIGAVVALENNLFNLGKIDEAGGDLERAATHYEAALAMARQRANRPVQLEYLRALRVVYGQLDEVGRLKECYRSMAEIADEEADIDELIRALGGLAHCLAQEGEHRQALVPAKRILEIATANSDPDLEAMASADLGMTYYRLDQRGEALGYLVRAVELFVSLGDLRRAAHYLKVEAGIFLLGGDPGKAIECCEHALECLRAVEDPDPAEVQRILELMQIAREDPPLD